MVPAEFDPPGVGDHRQPSAPNEPSRLAVAFGRVLRGLGVSVPMSSTLAFAEALTALGEIDRENTYWAGRATLVHSPTEIELYDRAFSVFWQRATANLVAEEPSEPILLAIDNDDSDEDDPDGSDEASDHDDEVLELRFSAVEALRDKDFAAYTDEELAEASSIMRRLQLLGAPRRSLRFRPARRSGRRHDLRRTVRAAMRTSGEPVVVHTSDPGVRPRRIVMLLDVSGSMEPYARALIRFAHAAVVARQRVEVFALGTRLTRITRQLNSHDPDRALRQAAHAVIDYGGGTRIGDGLQAFNDRWGQRGMARGAIVIILSDGWDRGDPELLGEQMVRLHRVAHRVIWVNPLKVTPGYAPLARGMVAALPHVDDFIEGHSIDALDRLAEVVSQAATRSDYPSPPRPGTPYSSSCP